MELHNLGMKTGRQELIDKGRYFIDDVLTSGRMFADGAVGYIGTQNEAGGYQGTVESYVNRYYQITGRPQALEILQKMEWYGPINGRMIDWWTSPSWKHAWNFISGSGQTGESTNGKNPYTRASLDASIAAAATATNWTGSVSQVGWYESGTTALTRPDTYTVFDRNIQGPRSWQGGLWNTTGTLRAINDSESGHHTHHGRPGHGPGPELPRQRLGHGRLPPHPHRHRRLARYRRHLRRSPPRLAHLETHRRLHRHPGFHRHRRLPQDPRLRQFHQRHRARLDRPPGLAQPARPQHRPARPLARTPI